MGCTFCERLLFFYESWRFHICEAQQNSLSVWQPLLVLKLSCFLDTDFLTIIIIVVVIIINSTSFPPPTPRSMQDPGLLQHQLPGVRIPTCFSPVPNTRIIFTIASPSSGIWNLLSERRLWRRSWFPKSWFIWATWCCSQSQMFYVRNFLSRGVFVSSSYLGL